MIIKIMQILFILLLTFSSSTNATTYYVATNGSNSNDGLSEGFAWQTIKYATGKVVAGDIVYIKAGTYRRENVTLPDGSDGSPIVFEGYKNIPGDVTNIDWWDYETNRGLDPTKMPLLDGVNRANGGVAVTPSSYTIVKNLQITNYQNGVAAWSGSHYAIENIIVTKIGDVNSSYSGTGIGIYYSSKGHNTIKNCVVLNAAAEGIMVYKNDHNLLENVKVYCDDAQNTYANTDYYFEIESNNNVIRNCYIERVGNLEHVGHGFCIKGDGYEWSGNLFENCTAKNLAGGGFVVRHHGVTNNTFKNCKVYNATGFLIREGANNNTYYNCETIDCNAAVRFLDGGEDTTTKISGSENNFYNCIFLSSGSVIDLNSYERKSDVKNNRFINCVIDKAEWLFHTNRKNFDNEIINSIIVNVSGLKQGYYTEGFAYSSCNFYNNGFDVPTGENLLTSNPLFIDMSSHNYHLMNSSPCINAGTSDNLTLPVTDFEGNNRIQGGIVDIGAYESGGVSAWLIANAGSDKTITDSDGNGSEEITLNGSGSLGSDSLTNYVWKENGAQIAEGVNPTVTLTVGTHTINLIVTDIDNKKDSDDVVITVKPKDTGGGSDGNYALQFNSEDKKDDLVEILNVPTSQTITIEFWVKLKGSSDDTDALLTMGGDGQRITLKGGSHLPAWSEGWDAYASNGITVDTWHHVAYVVNSGTLKALYLDGVFQTINGKTGVVMPGNAWYIASYYGGGVSNLNFVGCIDELRLWNIERTEDEIKTDKGTELEGNESGLIGYWNFNEGSGTNLTDKAGSLDGTLMNMEESDWVSGAPLNSTSAESEHAALVLPNNYALSQNYPNPFNPSTVISFKLPTSQNVELSVYNMLGEKVAELVNGNVSAGYHSVTFNASNLTSGIYIYRILASKFSSNKKMLLLK